MTILNRGRRQSLVGTSGFLLALGLLRSLLPPSAWGQSFAPQKRFIAFCTGHGGAWGILCAALMSLAASCGQVDGGGSSPPSATDDGGGPSPPPATDDDGVMVAVSPSALSLPFGAQQRFTASVTGAANTAVTWSVSPSNCGSIAADGLYTAPASGKTCFVKATSDADTSKSSTVEVIVTAPSTAAEPTFNPPNGTTSSSAITVAIACSSSGTVPYWTTGSDDPTTSSAQSSSATLSQSGTLKAICAGDGFANSRVAQATYVIDQQGDVTDTPTLSGRHILDTTGKVFIPRGPELVVADPGQTAEIDAIAATGANALRMLLTVDDRNNMTPQGFDTLVERAVSHGMVVWVSLFVWCDGACDPDEKRVDPALDGGIYNSTGEYHYLIGMDAYLPIWEAQWLKDLTNKYKKWVIIDAMQEFVHTVDGPPEGDGAVAEWVDKAKRNIRFFRDQGYTHPLEIMTSFEGRDLAAIVHHADEILDAETKVVNGTKQTLFGWQAYWGTDWYRSWQGDALIGSSMTATEAVNQFVATRTYPIMVGLDRVDIPGDESYASIMPACGNNEVGWLWWSWGDEFSAIKNSQDGYAGAVKASVSE